MAEAEGEQKILFNFLQRYQLGQHFEKLLSERVTRVQHLKNTRNETLRNLGFSDAEIDRLKVKLSQNFGDGALGKVKSSLKKDKFKKDSEEWERVRVRLRSSTSQTPEEDGYENPYVAEPHEVLIESKDVVVGEPLGEGAFGRVFRGEWKNKNTGVVMPVAIKMIELNEVGTLIREYQSLVKIRHPHVINMYGLSIDNQPMLIEEVAPLGSLLDFLKRYRTLVHLEQMHRYCVQVAEGMAYLARHNIVHRDLAARNVLLSNKDMTKICDFGMSRVLEESEAMMSLNVASRRVPYAWSALEIISEGHFSTYSDVWSFGVTMWEIYSLGKEPWHGLDMADVQLELRQGNRLARPTLCPQEIYKIMVLCWNPKPNQRPTFVKIREDFNKNPIQKLVAVREVHPSDDAAMTLRKGEIIYVASRDQDVYYGVSDNGSVGYVGQVYVTRDLTQAIPCEQPLLQAVLKSEKQAVPGQTAQPQFMYTNDVTEHTYDEVEHGATRKLPSPPWRTNMDLPPLQSRYNTPRRSYINQSLDAYEDVEEFIGPSKEYPPPQDYNPPNAQPLGTAAQERPVPKPRQRSSSQRADPTTSAPSQPVQSMYSNLTPYTVMYTEDFVRQQAENAAAGTWHDSNDPGLPAPLSANAFMTTSVGSSGSQTGGYVSINQHMLNVTGNVTELQGERGSGHGNDLGRGVAQLTVSGQHKLSQPIESCYSDQLSDGSWKPAQLRQKQGSASPSPQASFTSPKHQSPEPMGGGAQSYATAGPSSSRIDAQLAKQIAFIQSQLSNVSPEDCALVLQQTHGDTKRAITLLQVDMLMKMQFDYITSEDCHTALAHCQNKVDRAAEWLLEKSMTIVAKRV